MTRRHFFRASAGSLVALLTGVGCAALGVRVGDDRSRGHGPPPHAPAHGYRRKTRHGVEIVYDSGLGVYVVVELPGHYYHDDKYYRKHGGRWEISIDIDGPWTVIAEAKLPVGLRADGKMKQKKEPPGKGHDRDKN